MCGLSAPGAPAGQGGQRRCRRTSPHTAAGPPPGATCHHAVQGGDHHHQCCSTRSCQRHLGPGPRMLPACAGQPSNGRCCITWGERRVKHCAAKEAWDGRTGGAYRDPLATAKTLAARAKEAQRVSPCTRLLPRSTLRQRTCSTIQSYYPVQPRPLAWPAPQSPECVALFLLLPPVHVPGRLVKQDGEGFLAEDRAAAPPVWSRSRV